MVYVKPSANTDDGIVACAFVRFTEKQEEVTAKVVTKIETVNATSSKAIKVHVPFIVNEYVLNEGAELVLLRSTDAKKGKQTIKSQVLVGGGSSSKS